MTTLNGLDNDVFHVTVERKTPEHPWYGQGSPNGYVINGVQGAYLVLKSGKPYIFDVDAPGHPFYLTGSSTGGTRGRDSLAITRPIEQGRFQVELNSNLEGKAVYYQCNSHPMMGSNILVI
jgi:hypothetical protein